MDLLFENRPLNQFLGDFDFWVKGFEFKIVSSESKSNKNSQNHTRTNNEVLWPISKLTKIRDQSVEFVFLWCIIKYVPMVWVGKLRHFFVF